MQRGRRPWWVFLGLALMLCAACARQPESRSSNANAQNALPFDTTSRSDGISPTQAFASISIPAGTAIAIRLQSSLSSAESHSADQFEAVLDDPIVVQGKTLAPTGAAITGTVLEARSCGPREPGYLRVTLSSLVLNGKTVEVHTSSLFAKGGARKLVRSGARPANDVQFSTGRRLTFRLIQPLPIQG